MTSYQQRSDAILTHLLGRSYRATDVLFYLAGGAAALGAGQSWLRLKLTLITILIVYLASSHSLIRIQDYVHDLKPCAGAAPLTRSARLPLLAVFGGALAAERLALDWLQPLGVLTPGADGQARGGVHPSPEPPPRL